LSSLPPYGQVLTVRPEVFDPRGLLDMVDLGVVSGSRRRRGLAERVPGLDVLRDPEAFFNLTYPTHEIVQTLQTLSQRFANPRAVAGTILLSGHYGLGKSHVLMAAHHALTAPAVVRAWAARWNLSGIELPDNAVVITRSFIQHADEPLWDMMLSALSEGRKPKIGDFPDGERIESLIGDRPVFLVMDELERWYDSQDELSRSRNRNFLQALTEVSMRNDRLTLVASVLGEKPEPVSTIQRVKPLELSFQSGEDRQRVLLFRLFTDRDSDKARLAAEAARDQYALVYSQAGLAGVDVYRERMLATWPFSPEFLDILTKKIPLVGGFQNTRGSLRFLAQVVRHTCKRRPMVSSQDLAIQDPDIRHALTEIDHSGGEVVRRALGDNYESVPAELVHKDALFSTILLYSLADPRHPGATIDQILYATIDPGENALQIRDSLSQLKQYAFNLHEQEDRHVFLAPENPQARINAMANSSLVSSDAVQENIQRGIEAAWGAPGETAVYFPGDKDGLVRRMAELRGKRPRFLVSTAVLSPAERLELQNLDERRNLVLLIEPRVRTSMGDGRYRLLSDDVLVRLARRIEACKILLEGRPATEAARVYRETREADAIALRKVITERYGSYIAWHRAGATGAAVDDSWYEVSQLSDFSAAALVAKIKRDHSGQPELTQKVRERWAGFRHRQVSALVDEFEKTPGLPVPIVEGMVTTAVSELAREGVLSVVAADGTPLTRSRLSELDDATIAVCSLADPRQQPTVLPPERPPVHLEVHAHYDPQAAGVRISWKYPRLTNGGPLRTLVQRYATVRGWEDGRAYPLSTDQTHEANRHLGPEETCVDTERVVPGAVYHYYVFLVQDTPDGSSTFVLSRRCTVTVPLAQAPDSNVLSTTSHPDLGRLVAEVEKMVMSGKHMGQADRVRKIEVRLAGVNDPAMRPLLGDALAAFGAMEMSADFQLVLRGDFDRQAVLNTLRALPRLAGTIYSAVLHLKTTTQG
jgi:hypothetical protein